MNNRQHGDISWSVWDEHIGSMELVVVVQYGTNKLAAWRVSSSCSVWDEQSGSMELVVGQYETNILAAWR